MSEEIRCSRCSGELTPEEAEHPFHLCESCRDHVASNFYEAFHKILEDKYGVKIKYTIRKKTPEELAAEKATGIYKDAEMTAHCKQQILEMIVDEELKALTDRERHVLEQRYGYRGKPVTQKDLGIEFGVSPSRVAQIEEGALRKLRYPLDRIKMLESFLPQAISRGKNDFYARLFIKLFKMKQIHIQNILQSGMGNKGEE